jgi:DNA-binding LacI/PurR family transcriptional regulator
LTVASFNPNIKAFTAKNIVSASKHLRPTIKDVARKADVSHSTVSYVLNKNRHADRISEKTKQRIWQAVRSLGYKSNPIGRDLQRGYTNQVVLLIVTWNLATSHAETAMAISRAAGTRELDLTVHVADSDESAEAFLRRSVMHNQGGILVLWDSQELQKSRLMEIAADGVPVVDLLPGNPPGISVVTADREDAWRRGTEYLIGLGHKRIGIIGDVETRPKTTLSKMAGYRSALEKAGFANEPKLIENVSVFGFEGGYRGFPNLIKRCPDLTSLFCINDSMALGAMRAAQEMGLKCPKDISIIGFGDAPESAYSLPKLTTFSLSSSTVAATALDMVMELRRNPGEKPRASFIAEELIIRDSTGPAPVQAKS